MSQLLDLDSITKYLLAGKAITTFVSKKTGAHLTFRVTGKPEADRWEIESLTGPDNTRNFTPIAELRRVDGRFEFHRAPRFQATTNPPPSLVAFRWAAYYLFEVEAPRVPALLEVHHSGRCSRCGRLLSTPESVRRGLGPYCAAR